MEKIPPQLSNVPSRRATSGLNTKKPTDATQEKFSSLMEKSPTSGTSATSAISATREEAALSEHTRGSAEKSLASVARRLGDSPSKDSPVKDSPGKKDSETAAATARQTPTELPGKKDGETAAAAARQTPTELPGKKDSETAAAAARQTPTELPGKRDSKTGAATARQRPTELSDHTSGNTPDHTSGKISGKTLEQEHPTNQAAELNAATQMSNMAQAATIQMVSAPESVQSAPAGPAELNQIVTHMAERILVSSPDSNAPAEVRIQLNSSFLDGSEVRIFRENGELKVAFMAPTKDAENFIMQNKEQMGQLLGARLNEDRVTISVGSESHSEAAQQQHDGRSRQEYVGLEDDLVDD